MIIGKEHINAVIKQLFIHMVHGHVFEQLQSVLNGEILLLGHTTKSYHIAIGWNYWSRERTMSIAMYVANRVLYLSTLVEVLSLSD